MDSDDKKTQIKPLPDGPLQINGLNQLFGKSGKIKLDSPSFLCRCGGSDNKPFCDGAHKKTGFETSKADDKVENRVRDYKSSKLTVHFNRGACAHIGVCLKTLPSVFNLNERPWIKTDNADAEDIINTISKCPSGALSYSIEGVKFPNENRAQAVFQIPNGPYLVTGFIELEETELDPGVTTERYALCRCGKSNNKPFCDGAHINNKFE